MDCSYLLCIDSCKKLKCVKSVQLQASRHKKKQYWNYLNITSYIYTVTNTFSRQNDHI